MVQVREKIMKESIIIIIIIIIIIATIIIEEKIIEIVFEIVVLIRKNFQVHHQDVIILRIIIIIVAIIAVNFINQKIKRNQNSIQIVEIHLKVVEEMKEIKVHLQEEETTGEMIEEEMILDVKNMIVAIIIEIIIKTIEKTIEKMIEEMIGEDEILIKDMRKSVVVVVVIE